MSYAAPRATAPELKDVGFITCPDGECPEEKYYFKGPKKSFDTVHIGTDYWVFEEGVKKVGTTDIWNLRQGFGSKTNTEMNGVIQKQWKGGKRTQLLWAPHGPGGQKPIVSILGNTRSKTHRIKHFSVFQPQKRPAPQLDPSDHTLKWNKVKFDYQDHKERESIFTEIKMGDRECTYALAGDEWLCMAPNETPTQEYGVVTKTNAFIKSAWENADDIILKKKGVEKKKLNIIVGGKQAQGRIPADNTQAQFDPKGKSILCPKGFDKPNKKFYFNGTPPPYFFNAISFSNEHGGKWFWTGDESVGWQKGSGGVFIGESEKSKAFQQKVETAWKEGTGVTIWSVLPQAHGNPRLGVCNDLPAIHNDEDAKQEHLPATPGKAHEAYGNRYLFSDSHGVQKIDYQRDDASYGGLGTARDFIWNPRLDDYGRSKAFGYDGRATSSIDYMLLSVTFVVFMAICCCLVVAVSFVSGYITKWWFSKKKKTQSDYDSISVSNV